MPKQPGHPDSEHSRQARDAWRRKYTDMPVVLERDDYRLTVQYLDTTWTKGGRLAVEALAYLEQWLNEAWVPIPADPHGHYRFFGPPENMEDDLWDTVLTVAKQDYQDRIRAAQARGEFVASTDTYYAESSDGTVWGDTNDYAYARANGQDIWNGVDSTIVGQWFVSPGYFVYEGFMNFDTAGLPDDANVTAAVFSLWGAGDYSSTNFVLEVFLRDWGDTLEVADYVAGANLGGLPKLATWDTADGWSASGFNNFTSEAAFPAYISLTGKTRIVVASDHQRLNIAPTQSELVYYWTRESAAQSWPKIVVTYSIGGGGPLTLGDSVNYARKCWWPSVLVSGAGSSPWQLKYACEEGITAEDRGYYASGISPAASAYWDYSLAIPQGGLQIPAGVIVAKVAYKMPLADDGNCTLAVSVTCDAGAWTSSVTNHVLAHTNNAYAIVGIPITVSGTPPAIARLATINAYVHVAVLGTPTTVATVLYPVPVDSQGTVVCGHVGLKTDQASVTAWQRNDPVVILESPHAGSHENPTKLPGPPVLRLSTEGLYPTDLLDVYRSSDAPRGSSHDATSTVLVYQALPISEVTAGIMMRDTTRRYVEIGHAPYLLPPPDAARDRAPTAAKWLPNHYYGQGVYVVPTYPHTHAFLASIGGTSGATEPTWPMDDSQVTDGSVTWSDLGERYEWESNTYYHVDYRDPVSAEIQGDFSLEAALDTQNTLNIDGTIAAPQLVPLDDCTSNDEITLRVHRGPAHADQNPLAVEFELIYPDGTVLLLDAGYTDEQYIGRLPA